MSVEYLHERLTALQESNVVVKELITRLDNIEFHPGSIPLSSNDGGAVGELVAEILQTLKEQDEDWELLKEEVNDIEPGLPGSALEDQKRELVAQVRSGTEELKIAKIAFRRAQLSARRRIDAAQRQERAAVTQALLKPQEAANSAAGRSDKIARPVPIPMSREEQEVNASSDVTAALRRAHASMANELSRSQYAHETLRESTAALAQLSDTYSRLDFLLLNSRTLLTSLLRSQKSDTWYLETSFYILSATICWLVFRRLLYGPLWWFFWFPMKMFVKGWTGVFTAMKLVGGSGSNPKLLPSASHVTQLPRSMIIEVQTAVYPSRVKSSNFGDRDDNMAISEKIGKDASDDFQMNMAEHIARILEGRQSHILKSDQKKAQMDVTSEREESEIVKKFKPKDEL